MPGASSQGIDASSQAAVNAPTPCLHSRQRIDDAPVQQEPIMSDNILSAVLTFSLMAGGTAAIGAEMFNGHHAAAAPTKIVTLAPVTVIGHRKAWTEAAVENDDTAPKIQ
jgi:hypothetical protein